MFVGFELRFHAEAPRKERHKAQGRQHSPGVTLPEWSTNEFVRNKISTSSVERASFMLRKPQNFIVPLLLLFSAAPVASQESRPSCFTPEARALAERTAKVWQQPDPG